MANLSSVYTIIGVDALAGPASRGEDTLVRLWERTIDACQKIEDEFTARQAAQGIEDLIRAAEKQCRRGPQNKAARR